MLGTQVSSLFTYHITETKETFGKLSLSTACALLTCGCSFWPIRVCVWIVAGKGDGAPTNQKRKIRLGGWRDEESQDIKRWNHADKEQREKSDELRKEISPSHPLGCVYAVPCTGDPDPTQSPPPRATAIEIVNGRLRQLREQHFFSRSLWWKVVHDVHPSPNAKPQPQQRGGPALCCTSWRGKTKSNFMPSVLPTLSLAGAYHTPQNKLEMSCFTLEQPLLGCLSAAACPTQSPCTQGRKQWAIMKALCCAALGNSGPACYGTSISPSAINNWLIIKLIAAVQCSLHWIARITLSTEIGIYLPSSSHPSLL